MRVVDCQGLAGSFTLGCVQEGFELVGVRGLPGGFGIANLEGNRQLLGVRWESEIGQREEWTPVRDVELVAGNPPCSGFSGLNTSKGAMTRGPNSKINDCMWAFAHYTARCRPQVAIFESVQAAGKEKGRGGRELMRDLWRYVRDETGIGYQLTHVFMSGASVGAAQYRHRYFWVISQVPFGVDLPDLKYVATYRDAIGDLIGLENMWDPQDIRAKATRWSKDKHDYTGQVDGHVWPTNAFADRVTFLIRWWQPGMTLKDAVNAAHDAGVKRPAGWPVTSWDQLLDPKKFSINGHVRVRWDKPGYVVTGAGGISFIHPEEPRCLSLRECARLMGFPDAWTWRTPRSLGQGFMWVGKEIPVESGAWIASWARDSIDGAPGSITGEPGITGERIINVTNAYKEVLV